MKTLQLLCAAVALGGQVAHAQHLVTIHSFSGSDGAYPNSLIGVAGVLYGTTGAGGAIGAGTVFELASPASPGEAWTGMVLYSFGGFGTGDAGCPTAIVMDKSGVYV